MKTLKTNKKDDRHCCYFTGLTVSNIVSVKLQPVWSECIFQFHPVCSGLLSIPTLYSPLPFLSTTVLRLYNYFLSFLDVEVQRMKKAVESLMAANEEKVQ